jgi:hypothetical protein
VLSCVCVLCICYIRNLITVWTENSWRAPQSYCRRRLDNNNAEWPCIGALESLSNIGENSILGTPGHWGVVLTHYHAFIAVHVMTQIQNDVRQTISSVWHCTFPRYLKCLHYRVLELQNSHLSDTHEENSSTIPTYVSYFHALIEHYVRTLNKTSACFEIGSIHKWA